MKKEEKKQKIIYAFIDSQNLYRTLKDQGWSLDPFKFRKYLSDKFGIERAYYFIGFIRKYEGLYRRLERAGFDLVFKHVMYYVDESGQTRSKGNVDAEIILKAMLEYKHYDQAVIVAGDGDYYCLIEHLKKQGKLRKLIVPDINDYSRLLKEFAGDIMGMNGLRAKLGE